MDDRKVFERIAAHIGNVSTFQHKWDTEPVTKPLTFDMMQHKSRRDKNGPMFAPATFNGTRGNESFVSATGLCIDFDKGKPDTGEILSIFLGVMGVLYSTHSHTPETPRYRIVFPLSRAVSASEHVLMVRGVKEFIPPELLPCIDVSCWERARAHYLPSHPPEQKDNVVWTIQDGEPLHVDDLIAIGQETPSPEEIQKGTHGTKEGTRPGDDYNRRHSIEEVMTEGGWDHMGRSYYRKPGDTSHDHHAKLHNGGVYVYSTNAPVPAGYYDAFSFLTHSEYGGDFREAAKDLAAKGYGAETPPPAAPLVPSKGIFISAAEFKKGAALCPLIGNVIEEGSTGSMFGPSGSGKSFNGFDMGACVATGQIWAGKYPCKMGLVLYLVGEGHNGMRRRVQAWETHHGRELHNLLLTQIAVPLNASNVQAITEEAQRIEEQKGIPVRFIIIDTLARHIEGNENAAEDMGEFIRNVDNLRRAFPKSSAMVVHHTGHAEVAGKRGRGHSSFKAALEFEIFCGNDGKLEFTKVKDGETPDPWRFKLRPVQIGQDEAGEPVTSCIVEYETGAPANKGSSLSYDGTIIIAALKDAGGTLHTDLVRDHFYEKRRIIKPGVKTNTLNKRFNRVLEELSKREKDLIREESGFLSLTEILQQPGQTRTNQDISCFVGTTEEDKPGHTSLEVSRMSLCPPPYQPLSIGQVQP